jgi:diguanylate cyclase (GGDEF)-like protein/PAS domain S-box-containing protein
MRISNPPGWPQILQRSLKTRLSIGVVAAVLAATSIAATTALYLVRTDLRVSLAGEQLERTVWIGVGLFALLCGGVTLVALRHQLAAETFLRDISARKRAERELEKNVRHLRTITDNVPALISHLDSEFRYTYANAQYHDWFALEPGSVVGRTVAEVFGESVFQGVKSQMLRALNGEEVTFEHAGANPGSPEFMLHHYIPDRDVDGEVIGIYRLVLDRTAQHNAELRVEASQKQLRAVTDNLPVLITYIGADERVLFMNATFHDWVGVDLDKAIDKPLSEVLGPELYGQRRDQLLRALAGERVEFFVESIAAGTLRSMNTIYTPDLRPDGSVAGVFALTTDVTRLKEIERKLERLARDDALTGLPNRRHFTERLEQAVSRCKRTKRPMGLVYLDVDRFKAINDGHGHAAGDAVLQEIGRRLSENVRGTDTAARLSGDEFVVILEELKTTEEAFVIAEKLGEALRVPIQVANGQLHVTTSMGVAYFAGNDATCEEILARADSSLYLAKAAGRNTFRCAEV